MQSTPSLRKEGLSIARGHSLMLVPYDGKAMGNGEKKLAERLKPRKRDELTRARIERRQMWLECQPEVA